MNRDTSLSYKLCCLRLHEKFPDSNHVGQFSEIGSKLVFSDTNMSDLGVLHPASTRLLVFVWPQNSKAQYKIIWSVRNLETDIQPTPLNSGEVTVE